MKGQYKSNILASVRQVVNKPKYVQKLVESVNKHVLGKTDTNFTEQEFNSRLIKNEPKESTSSENCEPVEETASGNSTEGSGAISFKDETDAHQQQKKTSFSTDSDLEKYQPKYYEILPEKCVVHITETPRPQKVDYKFIRSSTPTSYSGEITQDILKGANLIRDRHCDPKIVLNLSQAENTLARSPSRRSADDKFVVNLFESRQSKRWKRRGVCIPEGALNSTTFVKPIDTPKMIQQAQQEKTTHSEAKNNEKELNDEAIYKLKKQRYMECVKMTQTSNLLKFLRKKPKMDWSDELIVQRILLETDEKYILLTNKIKDLGCTEIISLKPDHDMVATINLSNFVFSLEPQEPNDSKYSDFYVMSVSQETQLLMSEVVSAKDNKIVFDEKFVVTDVMSLNFKILVKIFIIKLRTTTRTRCSIFGKKTKICCPMPKINFEDINTHEMEASVLKPSFTCCGEFLLTKDHINTSHVILSKVPVDSGLPVNVTYNFEVDGLTINSNMSGFLTLGVPNREGEFPYWERKWCALNGTKISIYNYPSDELFRPPYLSIDLEYCLMPLTKDVKGCRKKRSFLLKTGRPSAPDDQNIQKSNLVVDKYVFSADNTEDFALWTNELESILICLKHWQKLVFLDDYY